MPLNEISIYVRGEFIMKKKSTEMSDVMSQKDLKTPLHSIRVDSFNPRFPEKYPGKEQMELLEKCWVTPEFKYVFNSMKRGVSWGNRIVVRRVNSLPEEVLKQMPDIEKYEYVIVEGNTRFAVLCNPEFW